MPSCSSPATKARPRRLLRADAYARFDASRLVRDAVIRNPPTLAESSQRLSSDIKGTEPQIPWRGLAGFRNVIVHGYLGVDLGAVWLVVEQDLPATVAVNRMAMRLGPQVWSERLLAREMTGRSWPVAGSHEGRVSGQPTWMSAVLRRWRARPALDDPERSAASPDSTPES